jgi:hypothetical protein
MKVLCVQCMKLNDLPDGGEGKVRFPCPNCGFVTVVTRKGQKMKSPQPPPDSPTEKPAAISRANDRASRFERGSSKPKAQVEVDDFAERETNEQRAVQPNTSPRVPSSAAPRPKNSPMAKSLHDELFDGSEKQVGDWMVRRLDGTEAGPLTFDALKQMIREGDIGKIDEVRRLDERYVPAAFHELTAELFNELDMAEVGPPGRKG